MNLCIIPRVSNSRLLQRKCAQNAVDQRNPAFTAGGNKDAEIATPTIEDVFSPNNDRAAAAPEKIAINRSKLMSLRSPLSAISFVMNFSVG